MGLITKHPNAIIGGLLGAGGVGQAALWLLNAEGVHLSERQGGLVAAGVGTVVLAGARAIKYAYSNGAVGVWNVVLHGKAGPGSSTMAGRDETGPVPATLALQARIDELETALDLANKQLADAGLPVPAVTPAG